MKSQTIAFSLIVFFSALFALSSSSCTKDKLPPVEEPEFCDTLIVSYQLNIKPIIDTYCAYSGCHDGSSPGIYLSYAQILPALESGKISQRTLNTRDMPPSYAAAGLTELPEEEYNMLNCWISEGYPEN